MQLLAANQIKHIEDRIAQASIKNSSLSIDILDHVCCMIEERMDLGWEYKKAEKEVFNEIGVLQMKAIEQETNILTQNRIIMKKRTKIIGLIAVVLLVAGFTMKQLHLQGAGITWAVGVLTAVFGFALFLMLDRFSYEKTSLGKVNGIIGFLGAGCFILGAGLKLLHWPGAFYLAVAGGVILLIYYIISCSINTKDNLVQ